MKKKYRLLILMAAAMMLLTGCAMRTVEEMYALPKRPEEFSQLQSAIDSAMSGLSYCAPISGENQQSVQTADLDGDGVMEFLVFAAGNWERPLQVLIFSQAEDGSCTLADVIESNGTAFEQVEYAEFDDRPGCELIIGCQVSDQVLRSVSVYSYSARKVEQLLLVGYSKFLTCDLNEDGLQELMVMRPGEAVSDFGVAVLYRAKNGRIERSVETEMAESPVQIRRILSGRLQDDVPAVFVSCATESGTVVTDIFTFKAERLVNVASRGETDTSAEPLENFYVYAEDIDEDGVVELPGLLRMQAVSNWSYGEEKSLLRWYSVDSLGREQDKLYTFHYFMGGWYVKLDSQLASRISVVEGSGMYSFYLWSEDYREAESLFSIYVFTGADREEAAVEEGRFALHRTEAAVYAAKLETNASLYGITENYLIECFRMIRQDRRIGES